MSLKGQMKYLAVILVIIIATGTYTILNQEKPREVVIYTSVDQIFSEPILDKFEETTGIKVKAVYDVEATKTTGLVNRLIAEKENPLADVWWNGEIAQTILLKEEGVLTPYASPEATGIPAAYIDPEGYWTGFGGRARVCLVNTELVERARKMANREEIEDFDEEFEVKEYLIPKNIVNALIDNFSIIRNKLSEVLDLPASTTSEHALGWWRQQSGDDQIVLKAALTAIAAPAMISQISIMRGNEKHIQTTMAQESSRVTDPCFLIGEDEEGENVKVRRLRAPDVMIGTMLVYLDSEMDLGVADFNFTTEIDDFHTLLGFLDLYRHQYYQALMEHEPLPTSFKTEDVRNSINDAHTYGDPRWLLPFALPVLPNMAVPDQNTLNYSLYDLGKIGIINSTSDYSTVTLADATELLCDEMVIRPASIRITNLGFDDNGNPAAMSTMFIRSENLVWFINIGGDTGGTASWAVIDLDKASELMKELFTPVGAPTVVAPKREAPTKKKGSDTKYCSLCGKEATWIEQYQRWYCYSCQRYLDS